MKFIHIGFGAPYRRSYEILQCNKITSSCAKKGYRESFNAFVAEARIVDEIFRRVFEALAPQPIHSYRYSNRIYRVYSYSETLWKLVTRLVDLGYYTHKYCKTWECIEKVISNITSNCVNVDRCLETVNEWIEYMKRIIRRQIEGGRKALLTRLARNHEKAMETFLRFFPNGLEILVLKIPTDLRCREEAQKTLEKFFGEQIARRYATRICRETPTIYLFARDDLFALAPETMTRQGNCFTHDSTKHCIYIDDYNETKDYAAFKIVNMKMGIDNNRIRILWVAVLGYDKHTNQIFLHYVPRTLALHNVETCRKWILGIVNEFGIERDYYEIIEV